MTFYMRFLTPLAALLVLVGCQPEPHDWRDDYTFAWEGEHVTVYGYDRSEDEVCGGSFAAVDQFSASIIELFDFDDSIHFDYHWMSSEFFEGKCPPNIGSCTALGYGPRTRSIPNMHEVAHALSYGGKGRFCPSVLEEGLAEYLTGPSFYEEWYGQPELSANIALILTKAPIKGGAEYERAGHFASFLLETYGPEAVMALCERIPVYHDIEDWEAAVPELLGVKLTELLAEYDQYPVCSRQQYRARLWECDGEPDAVADATQDVVFEVALDCSDPGTIGPLHNRAVATRRIYFPEAMRTGIFITDETGQDPRLDFNLQECAACSADPDIFTSADLTVVFNFRAGMYDLILFGELDQPQKLTIRLEPF
jgi:hypothetical protein